MEYKQISFIVDRNSSKKRLDIYLKENFRRIDLPEISRSFIKNHIKELLVNNQVKKLNYKVKENDEIMLTLAYSNEIKVEPENIPLEIIYQDEHIAVINKQPGISVHPSGKIVSGTLVNADRKSVV